MWSTAVLRKVVLFTCAKNFTRQSWKLLWVMAVFMVAWVNLKVFQHGGGKQHKYVFVFSCSLLLNHLEPQSSKAKLLLPLKPIYIDAYAFTISWDNLCRNSCIKSHNFDLSVFCLLLYLYYKPRSHGNSKRTKVLLIVSHSGVVLKPENSVPFAPGIFGVFSRIESALPY